MIVLVSKVFAVLLAVIAISKSYVDFRARRESLQMFLFWTITWTAIVVVALFRSIVASLLEGQAGVGTFLGMAVVFMFFMLYRIYVKLERLEQKITTLVQDIALREHWRAEK
jgi:hypothetical protein